MAKGYLKYLRCFSPAQQLIILFIALLTVGSVFKAYHFTTDYGGIDLRARVVGARLLHTNESPYFFKWTPAYSDRLLMFKEINEADRSVNGVTQAPGFLYFQSLFNNLPFRTIQLAWSLCQYILIGYIFYFFLFKLNDPVRNKFLPFVVGAFFFLASAIWFISIERGQAYVLFAFVFCMLYQFYLKEKPFAYFLAGAVVAVTAYCRPNFLIFLLPLLIAFNRWTIAGFIAAAIPLAIHGWLHIDLWKDYNNAMAIYTGTKAMPHITQHTAIQYPAFIEGIAEDLISKRKTDFQVGGIQPVMERIQAFFGPVNPRLSLLMYGTLILGLLWFLRKELLQKEPANVMLCGFLLYIAAEYTMPVGRGAYTLVQWVFPVMLMLQKRRLGSGEVVLLIAGLCLITDIPTYLPYMNDIGELLLVICTIRHIRKQAVENRAIA